MKIVFLLQGEGLPVFSGRPSGSLETDTGKG